jgi:hypothetical protein
MANLVPLATREGSNRFYVLPAGGKFDISVIPAKLAAASEPGAGIQGTALTMPEACMDSRLRGNDEGGGNDEGESQRLRGLVLAPMGLREGHG